LPEPYPCGSGRPKAFETTTANEIDPSRYDRRTMASAASTVAEALS
jgi:hypothetical protein